MREHNDLVSQVLRAQTDSRAADLLIEQYMPFIRSEAVKTGIYHPSDADDAMSIAMFAFYESIVSYRSAKGAFLKLAALAIRNRLIDYRRKQRRHQNTLSLDMPAEENGDERTLADQLGDTRSDLTVHQERWAAQQEISHFSLQLADFGLELSDVAQNCPKQERTLAACMQALAYAKENPALLSQLLQTKKLPIAQLSQGAQVEKKTLERHRKYMVAVLLAYTNGFEIIRGHLQTLKRKGEIAL